MEVLRTPDERFNNLKRRHLFEPHYTNIKTHDGPTLRIHHIDEGQGWPYSFSHAWSTSLELFICKNDSFFSEAGIRYSPGLARLWEIR